MTSRDAQALQNEIRLIYRLAREALAAYPLPAEQAGAVAEPDGPAPSATQV